MKSIIYLWAVVLLILTFQTTAESQKNQIIFTNITSENGLSEDVINGVFQDSRGFMWFGTNDGLNRYDGYSFNLHKPSLENQYSINSNLVFALTEDKMGKIWVGTTGFGLNRFDPITQKFTSFRHDANDENTLTNDQIVSLFTDQKGRIWVGTGDGLSLLIPDENQTEAPKIKRIKLPKMSERLGIYKVVEDKSGNIWAATNQGLFRCLVRDQRDDFFFQQVKVSDDPNANQIRSACLDQYGMLIIGAHGGLYHQSKQGANPEFSLIAKISNPQSIVRDGQGKIWVGSYKGLFCFTNEVRQAPLKLEDHYTSDSENEIGLTNNVIKSMIIDHTGIIWLGTNGGGITKFDPNRKQFRRFGRNLFTNGNRYKEIRTIFEDSNQDLWIGTEGGGLFWESHSFNDNNYNHFEHIGNSSSVFTLAEVKEGDRKMVYIGSEDPPFLQTLDITTGKPQTLKILPDQPGSVFSILQTKNNILWIGSYNQGLNRWILDSQGDYEKTLFQVDFENSIGLKSNIIRKVLEDRDGNVWIGTSMGLHVIKADQLALEKPIFISFQNQLSDPKSLSQNYILEIFESSTGELWIGTFGGGLNKVILQPDLEKSYFERISESDGLANNTIKSIAEDIAGNLWIASNRGISKFDPLSNKIQNYTTNDGLQAREFFEGSKLRRYNDELLFGGVNGFNIFYPSQINSNKIAPQIFFTKLYVNNQEIKSNTKVASKALFDKGISSADKIKLKYNQNDFSLEFAALHYASPKNNQYAYKLEGYHDDWVFKKSDQRIATFTNLPHGDYKLRVKASNSDDFWTEHPIELGILIAPPIWLTWYAYVFYLALILGAMWLFRKYSLISINEKHELMLEHIEREKLEELNQMKLRFFTNISHELRTPLTLILAPLEHILEKGKSISPEKLQQQYHYMYKNGKYLLRLVNQLLDFRKLDRGSLNLRVGRADIVDFITETTEPFQFIANKKNIRFTIVNSDKSIYSLFDPNVLEKVMYNLLSNAFKFTPEGGQVSVKVLELDGEAFQSSKKKVGRCLEIRVDDSGPGISKRKKKKIFVRFYKESSKNANKDGAGIGLAYTKSLVELHHGEIDVESKKGEGSCFIVRLPMEKKDYLRSELDQIQMKRFVSSSDPLEYLIAEPIADVPLGEGVMKADGDLNYADREADLPLLLFVDDNADIRRFIREGFKNDFRIIEANDGQAGYEIALSSLPDIIVSDVIMPNMNGIELCESLKTNALTSHIPIVLLTAKSAQEDELEGLKTGADAYVVKPFKLDILRAQLLNINLRRDKLKQRFRQEVILQPEDVTVTSADEDFLKNAMSIIEDHMSDSEFNVEALVKEMHISRSKLYLKLKALTGQSSSEFIRTVRLKRAIQLLEKSDYTIKEIMFMTGFNTASYFSKCFKNQFGVVPSEYLRKKKDLSNILDQL